MPFKNLRYLSRLKQILTVFFEEGFGYVIKKAHLHHFVPFSKRWQSHLLAKEKAWKPEVHLRKALEKLGPTFIKFGQTLSLRPDILPIEYMVELEKMQDQVPPVSIKQVNEVIRKSFGKNVKEIFSSFDTKPIASASLAQVHKAKLKNGKIVAVKIQRPGIEELMRKDMEILLVLAHWLDKHKVAEHIPFTTIVEEFKRWTLRELNFHYEAINLTLVRNNFKAANDIVIPYVYSSYSNSHVLTTELIEGVPLHNIHKFSKIKCRNTLKKAYNAMLQMVFVHGFFHADPHPGNILVLTGQKVAFVDFGIVGRFDQKLRRIILHLFEAILENDTGRVVALLVELGTPRSNLDLSNLRVDLNDMLDQVRLEKIKEINISDLLEDAVGTLHRHKIHIPIDFVLFAKTIITLEGIGLRYNPDFRLMAETTPLLRKIIFKEKSPQAVYRRARLHAREYKSLLDKAPEYLSETFRRISRGKLEIEIVPKEFKDLQIELEHGAGNIAIGLMTAALIVASALIMQVTGAPQTFGIPTISFFGFLFSAVLGIWLIRRTLFAIHTGGDKRWT
jgi:ubiquinone biosynthesis protein